MQMKDAGCLMVVTHTAADALSNQLRLSFENESQPLLVWGSSSAVGTASIQFAKKAGCYPIFTTASPKNHAKLLEVGATECFDYNDKCVVQNIRSALLKYSNKPLKRVIDCVVSRGEPSSTILCETCVGDSSGSLFTSPISATSDAKNHWSGTFACRNVDVDFKIPNGPVLKFTADQVMQDKIDEATSWAIPNYWSRVGKKVFAPWSTLYLERLACRNLLLSIQFEIARWLWQWDLSIYKLTAVQFSIL